MLKTSALFLFSLLKALSVAAAFNPYRRILLGRCPKGRPKPQPPVGLRLLMFICLPGHAYAGIRSCLCWLIGGHACAEFLRLCLCWFLEVVLAQASGISCLCGSIKCVLDLVSCNEILLYTEPFDDVLWYKQCFKQDKNARNRHTNALRIIHKLVVVESLQLVLISWNYACVGVWRLCLCGDIRCNNTLKE